MQLNARIKHKRDTASNWATKNPTPLDGEIIIVETTDGNTKVKVGDGSTPYNNLPFVNEDLTIQVSENTSNISTLTNTKVTGVTSATSGNVVVFDGTGGRLIKDSGKSLVDYLSNEEILEATNRVSDVEVNPSVATVEALQTAIARLEANQNVAKHNVGEEWHSYTGKIPEGGVPYCGQEVTRSTYSDLWTYAQAQGLVKSESEWQSIASTQGGNVPFYSSGNDSTTFRMPRIVGYMKGASSQNESGSYVAEGLPNHYHIQGGVVGESNKPRYGLTNTGVSGGIYDTGSTNSGTYGINTSNAQDVNGIYGNSSHVTPETSVVLFGVYAFGVINEIGALDATTLATGLATVEANLEAKLDKTTPHVIETWRNGRLWYRKWSDGWVEQGNTMDDGNLETVTFPVAFRDIDYTFIPSARANNDNAGAITCSERRAQRTATTAYVTCRWNGSSNTGVQFSWYACGY